ncbi:MAG: hypothetical protein ACI9G1_002693, partial [Pirellulaceae bacterium]
QWGVLYFPINQTMVCYHNTRLGPRAGDSSADFPKALVVEEPLNKNAH